jgi:hypothetical protein
MLVAMQIYGLEKIACNVMQAQENRLQYKATQGSVGVIHGAGTHQVWV